MVSGSESMLSRLPVITGNADEDAADKISPDTTASVYFNRQSRIVNVIIRDR